MRDSKARRLAALALKSKPIAQSAIAQSHSGDTTETTLATVVIPAGTIGANGSVEIITLWSAGANNANGKTAKIKINGTGVIAQSLASTLSWSNFFSFANRGANAQVYFAAATSFATSGSAPGVLAIDTATQDVTIAFTATNAVAGDTLTLERYIVKVHSKA